MPDVKAPRDRDSSETPEEMESGFERDHMDAEVANEAGQPTTTPPDLAGQLDAARRMGDQAERDTAKLRRAQKRRDDRDERR